MNAIDIHAHVFSASDPYIADARYTPKYDASVEQFIQHLDELKFKYDILIQPIFLGTNNQLMLEAIEIFPKRIKGIAVFDLKTAFKDLLTLKQKGINGLRLNLFGLEIPSFRSPEWQKFLTHLEVRQWQIKVHARIDYLIKILPILTIYKMEVIIDNFGQVDVLDEVFLANYKRFLTLLNSNQYWVKVTGFYRLMKKSENIIIARKIYQLFKERNLLRKLVCKSDYLHTQYESLISYAKYLRVFIGILDDEKEQSMILNGNLSRLFNLKWS